MTPTWLIALLVLLGASAMLLLVLLVWAEAVVERDEDDDAEEQARRLTELADWRAARMRRRPPGLPGAPKRRR